VAANTLTLADIPPEAFDYRLGNRSALEWVVDQCQMTTDSRSGIVSDPNRYGDERYIVDMVEKVVRVSVETAKIVNETEHKRCCNPYYAANFAPKSAYHQNLLWLRNSGILMLRPVWTGHGKNGKCRILNNRIIILSPAHSVTVRNQPHHTLQKPQTA